MKEQIKEKSECSEDGVWQAEYTDWASQLIGKVVGGRYRLKSKIAEGGMGLIFRAHQKALDRDVAVKIISNKFLRSDDDLERFAREAKGLSVLQHPNVVTIFDFGYENGLNFIVMEYVRGETISDIMRRRPRVSMKTFAQLAPQILAGIGAAHQHGMVHRDIKPSNVIITVDEKGKHVAKILDFGLARLVDSASELTQENLVGTFAFVSPEQVLGERVGLRSDVYALGTLFYHMLSGQMPFGDAKGMQLLYSQAHEEPAPLGGHLLPSHEVPSDLIRVVETCLSKDPMKRPRDANELLEILEPILDSWEGTWSSNSSSRLFDASTSGGATLSFTPADLAWIAERQAAKMESVVIPQPTLEERKPRFSKAMAVSALVGAVALLAVGGMMMAQTQKSSTSRPVISAKQNEAGLQSTLDRAQTYLGDGDYGKAERLLKRVRERVKAFPALQKQADALWNETTNARLFAQARMATESGDKARAIESYKLVLEQDGGNKRAHKLLTALTGTFDEQDTTMISLRLLPDRAGYLYVNDIPYGHVPGVRKVPKGIQRLEIRAAGYRVWKKTVEVKPKGNPALEMKLEFAGSGKSPSSEKTVTL